MAVQTLTRWYEAGADAGRNLPLLSTFLDHVCVARTYSRAKNKKCHRRPLPRETTQAHKARSQVFGFGVNATQCPCGLIAPSTILQVPSALAVLPGMN